MYNIYIYIFLVRQSISGTDISIKILPVVHIFSLTIMTYLKKLIGIKSLNLKQCPTRLFPPVVKLSSFIGGEFPSKNETVIHDLCLSLCL